jgi:hypothetical protein
MAYTYPVAPVGSIYQVTFFMTWCAQVLMNTFHYRLENNTTGQTINSVCDDMNTAFGAASGLYPTHQAARDGSCNLDRVTIQQIATLRYVPLVYVKNVGGDIVPPLDVSDTPNISASIEKRGVNATRGDVGGIRFPIPGGSAQFADGLLTVGYKVKLTNLANAMQTDLALVSGNNMKPVIYHRGVTPNYSYVGAAFFQDTVRAIARRVVRRGI